MIRLVNGNANGVRLALAVLSLLHSAKDESADCPDGAALSREILSMDVLTGVHVECNPASV